MRNIILSICMTGILYANVAQARVSILVCNREMLRETPVGSPLSEKISAIIKKLPEEGGAIDNIELVDGIRAMDGEIPTPGEVKVLVNLNWQGLPKKTTHRQALDNASARIVTAVFSELSEVTKLRVIVRTVDTQGQYQAAAKVFSFTRATWELTNKKRLYDVRTSRGVANLLSLGDYVILTEQGWMRGH